ncbi:MAG TPA: glycosyltransferase family 9 protein [Burkholderiales bacterium]|nr:glycosyltransferase family 9 protein [Burkholderiales bacterium]
MLETSTPLESERTHGLISGVKNIVALRPNAIGDFVFALPALFALRTAYPDAHIVFIGKRWHVDFLHARPTPIDEVLEIPMIPGVGAPENQPPNHRAEESFIADMRRRHFDIAFQLYGGGRYSNALINRIGARWTIGSRTPDAPVLNRSISYFFLQNERLRLLEVVGLAGAKPASLNPRLNIIDDDLMEAYAYVSPLRKPLAVLQPGATDPRRRWPPDRFAFVGDALANAGATIAINGANDERPIVAEVAHRMKAPAIDLSGALSLSGLAGLLSFARVLVSNDTGPLHLAQAVGTPTVGIYWLTNLFISSPLVHGAHRSAVSLRVECPICGVNNLQQRCAHDPCFVDDVNAEEVAEMACSLFC